MNTVQQLDKSITKENRRSLINMLNAILSIMVIFPMIYYLHKVWSSRYCLSAIDDLVKNKKVIFVLAILNVILSFGAIIYTISINDIMGTISMLSTYFFTLSLVILLWSWKLYRGNTDWCIQELQSASLFVLFSLIAQFIGYIITIINMLRSEMSYMSILKEHRQVLVKMSGTKKKRKKNKKNKL